MKRVVIDIGAVVLNVVVHLVGFVALALHGLYPLLFEVLDLGRVAPGFSPNLTQPQALTLAAAVAAAVSGAVSERWSRRVAFTALPASLAYVAGLTVVAMSMFLVDKGDPSIMWGYVLPRAPDVVPATIVGSAAALGWLAARRYRNRRSTKAVGEKASLSAPSDDQWTFARMDEDGASVALRFRSAVPSGINTADYPWLINIYWRFEGDGPDGMPSPALYDRMSRLETLLDVIEGEGRGFLVLSVTGRNRKEWIWYVPEKDAYMARVRRTLSDELEPFPVEFESSHDPSWSSFTGLLRGGRPAVH